MRYIRYILFVYTISLLSACSGTKGIQPDDKLFTGTDITYTDEENIVDRRQFKNKVKLNEVKPNTPGFLNILTGIYNLFGETKGKGLKHRIKYGWGSQPVVYKPETNANSERRLTKFFVEEGYLQAKIECDSTAHKRKRKVALECEATLGKRYVIDSVFFIQDTLPITKTLESMYDIEYTKAGDYYEFSNLIADRNQFVSTANDNGFPFVKSNDFIFFLDTLAGDHKVDVHMRLRPSDDALKYERFRYGGIYINPNYSIERDSPTDTSNMVKFDEYNLAAGYDFLRESALNKAVFINEGKIFNQKKRKITVDRLQDFGLFKFVNVKTVVNREQRTLDHFINLTTYQMESISGELELNNRQGNYLGIGGKVSYVNRNLFKGAERFELSLLGGLETQIGDEQSFINTSEIRLEAKVTLPNVVLPFRAFKTNRNFIPKTFMSLSVNQETRNEFYVVRAANAQYGFRWNETKYKSSFFTPIDMSWLVLTNTTPAFDAILSNDKRQALSFQSTLLLGSSYVYEYNKRDKFNPVNQTFFRGTFESKGLLLSPFIKPENGQDQAKLFNTPFAQYVRATADVRKFWTFGDGSIATRLLLGTGYAYGNSTEVPYSKQFSIGGANSIRAFRLRTLGPGTYESPTGNVNQFIDQTGDIKIESSIEYRFPIVSIFKGAVFVDAGNVWLFDSADKPEGVFNIKKFTSQIAVGTGIGLRLDFEVFLIRADLAFPLRNIDSNGDFEWVGSDVAPFSRTWRRENLLLNLGIGYPF